MKTQRRVTYSWASKPEVTSCFVRKEMFSINAIRREALLKTGWLNNEVLEFKEETGRILVDLEKDQCFWVSPRDEVSLLNADPDSSDFDYDESEKVKKILNLVRCQVMEKSLRKSLYVGGMNDWIVPSNMQYINFSSNLLTSGGSNTVTSDGF